MTLDLNQRPPGYEPGGNSKLPYPAISKIKEVIDKIGIVFNT